ncbi:hypothetical protein EB796_017137 [Bugula neritina]|uniref:Uncharacterized protein n=1 Tax=Bugula neritina TaxID=10212 RepID=A0A7J7JEV8_BUGNE|nr:hypothetical protein EB796_017137 [Bugula neritina]
MLSDSTLAAVQTPSDQLDPDNDRNHPSPRRSFQSVWSNLECQTFSTTAVTPPVGSLETGRCYLKCILFVFLS